LYGIGRTGWKASVLRIASLRVTGAASC